VTVVWLLAGAFATIIIVGVILAESYDRLARRYGWPR
jgi:hypothetical protein